MQIVHSSLSKKAGLSIIKMVFNKFVIVYNCFALILFPLNTHPAETYRGIFDFPYFNIVQSKVFDDVSIISATPCGSCGSFHLNLL